MKTLPEIAAHALTELVKGLGKCHIEAIPMKDIVWRESVFVDGPEGAMELHAREAVKALVQDAKSKNFHVFCVPPVIPSTDYSGVIIIDREAGVVVEVIKRASLQFGFTYHIRILTK